MWVTDKLILASKMGYKCGPAGIDVPESGDYCVRPVVNAYGLGIGAKKRLISIFNSISTRKHAEISG